MKKENRARKEQKALRISLYGVIFFVVLALGFAVYTKSDAILFDGIYSLISFATALLTLKVAKLAERPDDDTFHFGYTTLEPTLNLFKSLVIIIACVYAAIEALKRLLAGGTEAEYGWAVVYGVLATVGCFVVAIIMRKLGRDTRSDLVNVESKSWLMDALLSGSVLLGFILAWSLAKFGYAQYAPYVDPILLMTLVVLALPIPGKILLVSLREVIVMAPAPEVVDEIEARLLPTLIDVPHDEVEFRVNKRGRNTYVLVHVIVSDAFVVAHIDELDAIRRNSAKVLKEWNPQIVMDILFVRDKTLAY